MIYFHKEAGETKSGLNEQCTFIYKFIYKYLCICLETESVNIFLEKIRVKSQSPFKAGRIPSLALQNQSSHPLKRS